jgi:hypothetical protein
MYKNKFCKYCIITLVFLAFFAVLIKYTQAEEKASLTIEELIKKAEKVQTLMKEKGAEGLDVSKALKLDQESKQAAEKGDIALAGKLLDDAIASLTETSGEKKPAEEQKEPVTRETLVEKARKLRSLIDESAKKGMNVSHVLKLDQESRIATEKGDLALADKLLDDAIESLSESTDKEEPGAANTEPVTSESLMKKAEKLRALMKEKKAKGSDISETLKLDQMSLEAAEKGNFSLADKLLDDAIKSLTGVADKEKPGVSGKETGAPDKAAKKLETFHALIEEKLDKGMNVSEVFKLDQLSREAASKGDQALAVKLLDDAIKRMSAMTGNVKPAKKTVEIPVNAEKVLVTEGVPKYERGEEVEDYKSAFDTKTVEAKDGIVKVEVGYVPVFIEEAENTSSGKTPMENVPFGFHPANTYSIVVDRNENNLVLPSKMGYTFHNALDIGVRWTRPEFYANWGVIQKTDRDLKEGIFDWAEYDYVYGKTPKEIGIVGNIGGFEFRTVKGKDPFPRTFRFQTKELEKKYIFFVQKLVERYDGDGVDDMPGLQNPIHYWQVDNEPDIGTQDWEGFAHLVEITAKAIKSACAGCKVIMGGLAQGETGFDMFFLPVLRKLNGQYVDIFDFHSYGPAGAWHYYKLADKIKAGLAKTGFKNTDIWILESGTYCGKPQVSISGGSKVPAQTEKQQATDLIKRYVYGVSVGIKKIFWAFGIVEGFTGKGNHEFDYMGLMYQRKPDNAGRIQEAKKLGYYAYKKMTEKLEGCNFSSIKSLNSGEGVYAFQLNRSGKSVYVVWVE